MLCDLTCRWNTRQGRQLHVYWCTLVLLYKNFPATLWCLISEFDTLIAIGTKNFSGVKLAKANLTKGKIFGTDKLPKVKLTKKQSINL